jgi:hypothetical protein
MAQDVSPRNVTAVSISDQSVWDLWLKKRHLGEHFTSVLRICPVSSISSMFNTYLHSLIHHLRYTILATDRVFK